MFEFILLKLAESYVLVYQNPATDYIRLISAKPIDKVEIYDSSGKLYLSTPNADTIYLPDWQKRYFIVRIYMGDTVVTKNIIKN